MTVTGRETALDPMQRTPDGWPIINNLKGPSVLQTCPDLPAHVFPSAENPLDFGGCPKWLDCAQVDCGGLREAGRREAIPAAEQGDAHSRDG